MPQLSERPPDLDVSGQPIGVASKPPDLDMNGQPTFSTSNEKDASGNATIDPSSFLTKAVDFAKGYGHMLNPLPALQAIYDNTDPMDAAWNPIGAYGKTAVKGIAAAQIEQFKQGYQAYKEGRLSEALGHTLAGALPLLGPAAAEAGETIGHGDVWRGAGEAAAILSPSAFKYGSEVRATGRLAPSATQVRLQQLTQGSTPSTPRTVGGILANPNPEEAAAVAYGQQQGIPVDAGTASGNRAVKGVQFLADRSLAGSVIAEKARQVQGEKLATIGEQLAAKGHPVPVTAEQAGQSATTALTDLAKALNTQATNAYDRLRAIEARTTESVPAPPPITPAIRSRMMASAGSVPTGDELQALRRMSQELEAVPYQEGKLVSDNPGVSSESHYVPRAAGAPVYHDIVQAAGSSMTRAQVQRSINQALETGIFNNAAKGALEVARARLKGDYSVSSPILPVDAGMPMADMLMPVDLTTAKAQLKPLYSRLKRESELVPLMGDKARALTALDRIVSGPDHAPVSIVDAALGDLKSMARSEIPELRTQGQGLAAFAVKQLEARVQDAVQKAGPDAVDALMEGRNATVAKFHTVDVLEKLRAEPVQTFRQMVAPKDSGIALLRQVHENAPSAIPQIGRAYLEDLLGQATAEGGFNRAAKLSAEWQKLGPQTKRLLFGADGELVGDLDKFFLLAKRIGDNPNPSGTAHVLSLSGQLAQLWTAPAVGVPVQISAAVLAKLLRSPKAVKLLTQGLTMPRVNKVGAKLLGAQLATLATEAAGTPVTATAGQAPTPDTTAQR